MSKEKVMTYTLKDCGDMNLIDTQMQNIVCEIQGMVEGMEDEDFPRTVKIVVEKRYTQKQISELPEYEG